MRNKILLLSLTTLSVLTFSGCMENSKQMILENQQQLETRSYQIKKYDKSKLIVSRAVISTLQDLSFIVDKADMMTGTVTATKLVANASMKITIIIRDNGVDKSQVRANAQFSSANKMSEAVNDAETYQAFYSALDKAIFLEKEGL